MAAPKRTRTRAAAADLPEAQPSANPERGEHELELGGIVYRLRPSFAANVAIERQTGQSLISLAQLGSTSSLTLSQIGIIAAEWIKAGAEDGLTRNVGADRIAELAYEEGLPSVLSRLTICLVDSCTGGRTAEGNAKAVAA
ncbi:hypothetical protein [Sphingomonas sp. UYP23]